MKPGEVYSEFNRIGGEAIVLRTLRRSDLLELVRFANTLVRERRTNQDLGIVSLDRIVNRKDERKFLGRVLTGLKTDDLVSVAAFDGGRMIGNCDVLRRKPTDVHHTGVLGIVIIEGYRGIGLGEAMVRTALAQAKKIGVWLVELQVFASNTRAIQLYESVGFRRFGTIPDKILRRGRHIDEIQMYVNLTGINKSSLDARVGS
jgi:RimJ/RimL family protein N-acetyltransferase